MSDAPQFDRQAFTKLLKEWREAAPALQNMSPEKAEELTAEFCRQYASLLGFGLKDGEVRTGGLPPLDPQDFRKRLDEFLDRMTSEKLKKLSPEQLAEIMWEYSTFLRRCPKDANELTVEQLDLRAFYEDLLLRQGGIEPDYDTLYNKKAELDRKFFGPEM